MLGQCHDNQETKTCFDIVETTSTSRQKLSSYWLEHEKKIFSLVDPLNSRALRKRILGMISNCAKYFVVETFHLFLFIIILVVVRINWLRTRSLPINDTSQSFRQGKWPALLYQTLSRRKLEGKETHLHLNFFFLNKGDVWIIENLKEILNANKFLKYFIVSRVSKRC